MIFLPCVKEIPEDVAKKAKYMIVSPPLQPGGKRSDYALSQSAL